MHAEISETAVLSAAHSFVSLGLRKAGYEYVNIDVCLQSLLSSCPLYIYNTSGLLVPVQSPPWHKRIGSWPIKIPPWHQSSGPWYPCFGFKDWHLQVNSILLFRWSGILTVNIATLVPRPVQDIQVRWVMRLLTLLPGSLGILTVSSTITVIHAMFCRSLVFADQT